MTGSRVERLARAPFTRCILLAAIAMLLVACQRGSTQGKADDGGVRFRTADGFLLEGELEGGGEDGVILAHMYSADMSSWDDYASTLSRSYKVLRFNFRGYGRSEGSKQIALMDRDVKAAIAFMRTQGASRIVLMGASMGGSASLVAAAAEKVDGVVAISAPEEFKGLDALSAVAHVTARMFFVACLQDETGASDAASSLFKAALDPASDILLLPCDRHGTDIFRRAGSAGEEAEKMIDGFLSKVMS